MTKIFISHSSQDKKSFVLNLATRLHAEGLDVWYDEWSTRAGDRLRDKINDGIASCDYFLAVLSPTSINSEWVKVELDTAMIQEMMKRRVVVIALLIGNLSETDIPADLLGKEWVDFRDAGGQRYEQRIGELLHALGVLNRSTEPLQSGRNGVRVSANEGLVVSDIFLDQPEDIQVEEIQKVIYPYLLERAERNWEDMGFDVPRLQIGEEANSELREYAKRVEFSKAAAKFLESKHT